MGFRDIQSFNLAMLVKQGWKLLIDQGSLLYKCFKAQYFPRCSFLEASDTPNSSYVWKSLIAAQPILRKDATGKWVMTLPSRCYQISGFHAIQQTKYLLHRMKRSGSGESQI